MFKKIFRLRLFVAIFALMVGVELFGQTYSYQTSEFAVREQSAGGYWKPWSDWIPSTLLVTIDLDNDVVNIYSKEHQRYKITSYLGKYTDEGGGSNIKFKFVDQDGDIGEMRMRVETSGNSQLYIDFANIMWVYNLRRI